MDDQLNALRRKPTSGSDTVANPATGRRWRELIFRSLPWLTASAVLLIILLLFGGRLIPAVRVELESVVALAEPGNGAMASDPGPSVGVADAYSGTVLFQASGWIEAAPFPYRAVALAGGVVDQVHILEGEAVRRGEAIVSLVAEDAELRLGAAEAGLRAAEAALAAAGSGQALAFARVRSMEQEIEVALARRNELADLAERARELGPKVLPEQEIIQSGLRLSTQEQSVVALRAQLNERKIDAEEWASRVEVRQAMLEEAKVRVREAALELERMVVRAPVDGVIQRLMAAPGQKKLLTADDPESSTVALLFQPGFVQARIDVPIAEASRISAGQAVLLSTEYLPGRELRGRVERIAGEADLQRNTLQVKVSLESAPAELRPEVLCRARFLDARISGAPGGAPATEAMAASAGPSPGLRVFVPQPALFDRDGSRASVWAVDASGRRVERRSLRLASEERDGYVAVLEGLRPGDRVVLRPSPRLAEGKRIEFQRQD